MEGMKGLVMADGNGGDGGAVMADGGGGDEGMGDGRWWQR